MKTTTIFLILLLIANFSIAQTVYPPTGSPTGLNRFKGGLVVDSMFKAPVRDTTAWFGRKGDLVRMPSDNKIYYLDQNDAYKPIGGAGAGFINYADTMSLIATKYDLSLIDYLELTQTITGQTSKVFNLSQPINLSKHLIIVMNMSVLDPTDFSITGISQVTLSFSPLSTDKFTFYFKK